jgi:hypothetical protein
MPKTYRKKPVVVQAGLVKADNLERVAEWCGGGVAWGPTAEAVGVVIQTLEGAMRADIGDYVIRGVKGEFYPCKPDIFEATYELVSDEDTKEDG